MMCIVQRVVLFAAVMLCAVPALAQPAPAQPAPRRARPARQVPAPPPAAAPAAPTPAATAAAAPVEPVATPEPADTTTDTDPASEMGAGAGTNAVDSSSEGNITGGAAQPEERDDILPTGVREDPRPGLLPPTNDLLGGIIPVRAQINGYFRSRIVTSHNIPTENEEHTGPDPAFNPAFGYMRLRLDPSIAYGSDPLNPVAVARFQIDVLNNFVFCDNSRQSGVPVFAEDPSATDINGRDISAFNLKRAWLEFNIPVGQIRIGRQGSMGGLGLLFNDGNGFRNDWGDSNLGTTYDRVLFATRPMTIMRAIMRGDTRPTPLVFAIGHDWLVEDPLGLARAADTSRSTFPFATLGRGSDDVEQTIVVLVWNQPNINPLRATDELQVGSINVYRSQEQTSSDVYISDFFWRMRYSFFGRRAPAIVFNGEINTLQGTSFGLPIGPGQVLDAEGRTPRETKAAVWGGVFQLGAAADRWSGILEAGYSRGDGNIFARSDFRFDQRALHPDYHVGLLMYQSAIATRTSNAYFGDLSALASRGGVWNSKYLFPQFRYRVWNGVDVLAAFLLAWADQLNEAYPTAIGNREMTGNLETSCGVFQADCFLGWEADLALKVSWGDNDVMRWSTEFGLMNAGGALALEMQQDLLWTLQSRIAMVF